FIGGPISAKALPGDGKMQIWQSSDTKNVAIITSTTPYNHRGGTLQLYNLEGLTANSAEISLDNDELSPSEVSLYLTPPNVSRLYFGRTGKTISDLNFSHVSQFGN